MRKIEIYYENTKNALPHLNIQEVVNIEKKAGKAIDLGCGVGRDTIFLIKNNWNVLAVDREEVKKRIENRLNEEELKRFRFSDKKFEEIEELEENNLIVANFSLPFCNKIYFTRFWDKIVRSIAENGYFVGNFFGIRDSWSIIKGDMTFLTEEQVLELLKSFEIIKFKEIEKDGRTGLGEMKHWHIYEVIAKKK